MPRRLAAVLFFCLAFNHKARALQDQPSDSSPADQSPSDVKQDLETSFDKAAQAYLKGDPIGQKLPESALEKLQKEITTQDAESAAKLKELKELRSQALAIQSGRESGEDSQIYRTSIEVLADKLHVDHEPVLQLYGERVRRRRAGNAGESSGAPEANNEAPPTEDHATGVAGQRRDKEILSRLWQLKLKEEATQRLLRDSQLTPERRTELSQKADEYARQLGGLASTDKLVGATGDFAVNAESRRGGSLTPEDYKRLNAQAKQDYVKVKRSADPPAPKNIAADQNSSKLSSALKNKFGGDGLPPILPWSAGGASAGAIIGLYAARKKPESRTTFVASLAILGAVSGAGACQAHDIFKNQLSQAKQVTAVTDKNQILKTASGASPTKTAGSMNTDERSVSKNKQNEQSRVKTLNEDTSRPVVAFSLVDRRLIKALSNHRKADVKFVDYLVKKYGLDECQRRYLHDLITKQGHDEKEIKFIARDISHSGERRCPPGRGGIRD